MRGGGGGGGGSTEWLDEGKGDINKVKGSRNIQM